MLHVDFCTWVLKTKLDSSPVITQQARGQLSCLTNPVVQPIID